MRVDYAVPSALVVLGFASCSSRSPAEPQAGSRAEWLDVHGAGSQRSDPKSGDPAEYAAGRGPQGDAVRIENMVRAVRSLSRRDLPYAVVDTNQTTRFDNANPTTDSTVFAGQDADYTHLIPSYTDNGDGTVTDDNTGLMWQKSPGKKMTRGQAHDAVKSFRLGGHSDWRIPSIKELYSLIQFSGRDISPESPATGVPFIDQGHFDFVYGDPSAGERAIDSQYMSDTKYVTATMRGDETVFGVNFADGRIKGYGLRFHGGDKTFFVMFVRGNPAYGKNELVDNGDGTISDLATGLMWMQEDAGPMDWESALVHAEGLEHAGHDDWRLPNAKELQSIVDYGRSPATTASAAIDPVFHCTEIPNEAGEKDFGFYWSSTTHARAPGPGDVGSAAVYVAFGRATGNMSKTSRPDAGDAEPMPLTRFDPAHFIREALLADVRIEERELSDGTRAMCYVITSISTPHEHAMGPWSPRHVTDGKDKGGVWMKDGELHDVDGAFVAGIGELYADPEWNLIREDGSVRYTDTKEAFEAAARPDVDPRYHNHVVEGRPEWVGDKETTYVIPVQPVRSDEPVRLRHGAVGVAFNGVNFDPPAPVDAILAAHTIAPLDDAGGHLNPHTGYHYHAATGHTKEVPQPDGHAPMIGLALDGYPIFAHTDASGRAPDDLDECGGHSDALRGYHYHAGAPGDNQILGAFRGVPGTEGEEGDGGLPPGDRPPGDRPPGDRPPGGQGPPPGGPPPGRR